MPIIEILVEKDSLLTKQSKLANVDKESFFEALKLGGIQVNGKRTYKHDYKLKKGDYVLFCYGVKPPDIKFNENWIEYEDDYFICLNKPAGIPTQGTRYYDINHLYYFAKKYVNNYVGLHHRLDTDTSGLVLFTKDKSVNKYVTKLFENKNIKKKYLAIVHGKLENNITINEPIGKLKGLTESKYWINTKDSRNAETEIKIIKNNENFTMLNAFPKTGRTHQIRVHLASINHHVVGDNYYNKNEIFRDIRQLLHCQSLKFLHPITKKTLEITAKFPEDIETFIGKYFNSAL